ncbi:MAG: hypothetical protein EZS28_017150 [Streblomastix strix]|uniref:Uncharacterized protein n=1 Tax=Streblomastix strix TaxID=222440 RepID=A0A5J4VY97_9EUKA|nr:MAG: hypothetical protein EZS28_017150 [Streblomastix strix]
MGWPLRKTKKWQKNQIILDSQQEIQQKKFRRSVVQNVKWVRRDPARETPYKQMQLKDKIDQVYELEKAKPFKEYIDFGSILQKKK